MAFIGWRGFVGSVLMEEIEKEQLWKKGINAYFLSTSQQGRPCPVPWSHNRTLEDAWNFDVLREMDIILTCQGSSYTENVHSSLRKTGWKGFWIDSASALRIKENSTIVLDPVNLHVITKALEHDKRDFIGGNCSVSLMLMAVGGLLKEGLVEWVNAATYQAASGAGAKALKELLLQMRHLGSVAENVTKITEILRSDQLSTDVFQVPLAANLIPWIDSEMPTGQSREEWKGQVETNKILQTQRPIPIDGTCVRIGVIRCHSQALLIKLKKDVSLQDIEDISLSSNPWVEIIPNTREATIQHLNPITVSGSPKILVGRIHKLSLGKDYLNVFTCGDQLLWGAALPLLHMLKKLI